MSFSLRRRAAATVLTGIYSFREIECSDMTDFFYEQIRDVEPERVKIQIKIKVSIFVALIGYSTHMLYVQEVLSVCMQQLATQVFLDMSTKNIFQNN